MNEVFRPFLHKFVLVFFDDILVYSHSEQEHVGQLRQVLDVIQQQKLFVNRKKCNFGCKQVEYLGHVITKEGVAVDPKKINAMVEWLMPRNIKELRGFLGLSGY